MSSLEDISKKLDRLLEITGANNKPVEKPLKRTERVRMLADELRTGNVKRILKKK